MKITLFIFCLSFMSKTFGQSIEEKKVLQLSANIFTWEVEAKIDSVAHLLHKDFIVSASDGSVSPKQAYIDRLSGSNFKHNSIHITNSVAIVSDNTATVVGKGSFDITLNGIQRVSQLSYLEVFTRKNNDAPWKMLALKASVIN
jgi:hypothetical protein